MRTAHKKLTDTHNPDCSLSINKKQSIKKPNNDGGLHPKRNISGCNNKGGGGKTEAKLLFIYIKTF